MQHRVQHADVAAWFELHMLRGMTAQALLARITNDQLGTVLGGLLDIGGSNRVVYGWVRADDHDELSICGGGKGCCHSASADAFHQRRNRTCMAKTCAMVHVVGFKSCPDKFLEQVGFLV